MLEITTMIAAGIVRWHLVAKSADADLLRAMFGFASKTLTALGEPDLTGAARGESPADRVGQRNR